MKAPDVDELETGVLAGNRASLAKSITLIESTLPAHRVAANALLRRLLPKTGLARRIGITGVPGVGKSSFIEVFGLQLIRAGHKVAVLAVDPSSVRTGGSILGDKTRMELLSREDSAFIRPSPSSGFLGGVASHSREALLLCEAAGYTYILVETVGVGQAEVEVAHMVDFVVFLALSGAGDELQGIKRGILELVDAILVHKADGENVAAAERAAATFRAVLPQLHPAKGGWQPPVWCASSRTGDGMSRLFDVLNEYWTIGAETGALGDRRKLQTGRWWQALVHDGLMAAFRAHPAVAKELLLTEVAVLSGEELPVEAAERLVRLFMTTPRG